MEKPKIVLFSHVFQSDMVSSLGMEERKKPPSRSNTSNSNSSSSERDSSDSSDEEEMILLSDADNDIHDKTLYSYDEEDDYEANRAPYQLLEGYLEPIIVSQSANLFS